MTEKITTRVDLDENPLFAIQNLFCAFMSFFQFLDDWNVPAVFNSTEQTVTLENTTGFAFAAYASNEQWRASEGFVSFEQEIIQIDDAANFDQTIGIVGSLSEQSPFTVAGVYITSAGGGTITSAVDGLPLGNIIMQAGYQCGFKYDAGSNTFDIYDNQGNIFTGLAGDPVFDPSNYLNFFFFLGALDANKFVNKLNTGSRAFDLPQSSGIYCNQIYVEPVVCVVPTLVEIPAGDPQTIWINGQNVEAISLGFSQGATGITGTFPECRFTTQTEIVKFETQLLGLVGNQETLSFAMFFLDLDSLPQPTIFAAVLFIPQGLNNGIVLDLVTGTPIPFYAFPIQEGFISALYIDSVNSTAWFKDSYNNTYALAVDGDYNNALEITEGVLLQTGSELGQGIEVRMNFGGVFQLGDDGKRWCEV